MWISPIPVLESKYIIHSIRCFRNLPCVSSAAGQLASLESFYLVFSGAFPAKPPNSCSISVFSTFFSCSATLDSPIYYGFSCVVSTIFTAFTLSDSSILRDCLVGRGGRYKIAPRRPTNCCPCCGAETSYVRNPIYIYTYIYAWRPC
jgi:hypothetical protein